MSSQCEALFNEANIASGFVVVDEATNPALSEPAEMVSQTEHQDSFWWEKLSGYMVASVIFCKQKRLVASSTTFKPKQSPRE